MAQNGATSGITFLDKEKYGTEFDAIRNKFARKHIILHEGYYSHPLHSMADVSKNLWIKGALICGEGRQTKHLSILQMSVLHRSEQGICVPNANR